MCDLQYSVASGVARKCTLTEVPSAVLALVVSYLDVRDHTHVVRCAGLFRRLSEMYPSAHPRVVCAIVRYRTGETRNTIPLGVTRFFPRRLELVLDDGCAEVRRQAHFSLVSPLLGAAVGRAWASRHLSKPEWMRARECLRITHAIAQSADQSGDVVNALARMTSVRTLVFTRFTYFDFAQLQTFHHLLDLTFIECERPSVDVLPLSLQTLTLAHVIVDDTHSGGGDQYRHSLRGWAIGCCAHLPALRILTLEACRFTQADATFLLAYGESTTLEILRLYHNPDINLNILSSDRRRFLALREIVA
jgi:hypothetical protein